MDALRWWLPMKYDAVPHSPDRNVFEIEGSAVLCQSENEKISGSGASGSIPASRKRPIGMFASELHRSLRELAPQDPVFADLQNIFDLSLVAALLTDNRLPNGSAGTWGLRRGRRNPGRTFRPAQDIISVVNHRVYSGKDIVVQVAGGVDGRSASPARSTRCS